MTDRTADARAWFAEDLRVTCNLSSPRLIEALSTIPRERFLGPGPWQFVSEAAVAAPPMPRPGAAGSAPGQIGTRMTDDGDPRHVYHNISIAVDPARNLYNGQPGLIGRWLDALAVGPGDRVLHIGCGTGYFTALAAHVVGPSGRVYGIDVDAALAERARGSLAAWPWVEISAGDGRADLPRDIDVVIVNAGATHVLDEWLDATRDGARVLVPLTAAAPGMPGGIGKGFVAILRRSGDRWSAAMTSMVAIYSMIGVRDESLSPKLGQAMMGGKMGTVARLRRDVHEPGPECWYHGPTNCLSAGG